MFVVRYRGAITLEKQLIDDRFRCKEIIVNIYWVFGLKSEL